MILEFFINIIFNIVMDMMSTLPADFTFDTAAINTFLEIVRVATYLFPFNTLINIMSIVIGINLFRIVISIIKTIWELLPLV